ncbi:TfoX/Sxy family protein [Paracoccus methylovorus]|uniref:TfoX/Sxy family protein n=1 Tax=Paracoccus methylovorus TaxID=2812658 RepID=A0ABX7JMS1_9RHOB|nr:TfoX/Sxy family protein [Paracoccus methylovorus]QRZ14954.1 TfoX/Sxy family protein [Paracoccus methylovorus]
MPIEASFASFVSDQLDGTLTFTTKQMFGCVGLICDAGMFGLTAPSQSLYFRADDGNRQAFLDQHCEQFAYQTSRNGQRIATALNYFMIPATDLEDRESIARWAGLGLESARRSLRKPAQKARPAKTDPVASLWGL